MLGSYIKTSGRNIVRNKLFSAINIFGLSVSMAVGLLVISFASDLLSFDDFFEKKERIYRVNSVFQDQNYPSFELASNSVKAGKKIQETISGVEELTILRNGFGGDAHIGENIIPIEGLYADKSFFKVFSFSVIQGNSATALKEPHSIVVTESSAKKLFGKTDVLGKPVRFDSLDYIVTAVIKDVPKLCHLRFEVLISFSTAELEMPLKDKGFNNWDNVWSNYVYVVLPENGSASAFQANLDKLSKEENKAFQHKKIELLLQPLKEIALGRRINNNIGANMMPLVVWILGGLAFVVILSACFNYTNLSIARSLRRTREVGIRKVIGALKSHVLSQFMAEAIIISLIALIISFPLFLFLRVQFLSLDKFISDLVSLDLSPGLVLSFIGLALLVGVLAGFLPAIFFSKINAIQVLKNASSVKVFKRLNMRKALIVVQYTFSLIFITGTVIGYNQYKGFLTFDLGYKTENILNIKLQGNKGDLVVKELESIPAVNEISRSLMITSIGSVHGTHMKYSDPKDSVLVWLNLVDEHYLPIHDHQILAGGNFLLRPKKGEESEVIVNEQVLKHFNIAKGDPAKAIGEEVVVDRKKLSIVGVIKDFHYGTLQNKIDPVIFRYSADEPWGYLNLKVISSNLPETLTAIDAAWKKVDKVHPLNAVFYDDQIEKAYSQFSVMLKVIGLLAFLAICIASMGLFGMVVFTTETRLKEISIRKVLGASERKLVYLLGKGFLSLLIASALVAIPVTYLFFDKVVLVEFPYHQPITVIELLIGVLSVMILAFLMIGSQTLKAARSNPAEVLKSE
ncbi:MAG: FtsX-like permease family protein [Cyclobacteriaceae bacterium]|nr:FtsX-like permease family protein [Cyclobacteriaceae bacterium]